MSEALHAASGDAMKPQVIPQDTAAVIGCRPSRKITMSDGECDLCGLPATGTCVHCRRLPRAKDLERVTGDK